LPPGFQAGQGIQEIRRPLRPHESAPFILYLDQALRDHLVGSTGFACGPDPSVPAVEIVNEALDVPECFKAFRGLGDRALRHAESLSQFLGMSARTELAQESGR